MSSTRLTRWDGWSTIKCGRKIDGRFDQSTTSVKFKKKDVATLWIPELSSIPASASQLVLGRFSGEGMAGPPKVGSDTASASTGAAWAAIAAFILAKGTSEM